MADVFLSYSSDRRGGVNPVVMAVAATFALIGGAGCNQVSGNQVATTSQTPPGPAASGKFSQRMLGHWNWNTGVCKDGPNITMDNGKLVFTTPSGSFVHVIEKDEALKTTTRVIAPEYALGEQYELTPEFNTTSEQRSFNLIVKNLTTRKAPDTWSPCEVKQ